MNPESVELRNFLHKDGSNYRLAGQIDIRFVEERLKLADFLIQEKLAHGRHLVFRVHKDGNDWLFKMATGPGIGKRTANEVVWNLKLSQIISQSSGKRIHVPKILETGEIAGNFYFISEFIQGNLLGQKRTVREAPDCGLVENYISQIADLTFTIAYTENIELPKDREVTVESVQLLEQLNTKYQNFYTASVAKKVDLVEVLEFLKGYTQPLSFGLSHGDFTPWHLIETPDKMLYLIDGEAASSKTLQYYDTAYFYHRLYTSGERPDLARQFLQEFVARLPDHKVSQFWEQLRFLLAGRIVGGYWDAIDIDKIPDIAFHYNLLQDFHNNMLM